jgi:biofilm protein TabA
MIHDGIKNAGTYRPLSPAFERAFAWLASHDLASLEDGRFDIDGDEVYALVQSYTTEDRAGRDFETHRRYADIQVLVSGVEIIVYRQAEGLCPVLPYDGGKDFASWRKDGGMDLVVQSGEFAVFFPEDAHAPKIAAVSPERVKKIVVKVRVAN